MAASAEAFSEWSASISQSLAMGQEKEEAQKIIREAEMMKQEIIRKAEIEAAKITQAAKDQVMGKIRTQSSDDFRTPEDRIRRAGSDDQVALVQIRSEPSASPAASNAGGSSSSSKKQASLHAFIKSPTPKHVIQHPLFSKRVQEAKEMRVLRQLQDKYDDHILNQRQRQDQKETEHEEQDETTISTKRQLTWQEFGKMGGRPSLKIKKEMRGLAGGKRTNRRGTLEEPRKKEFTAYQKMIIVQDINEKIKQGLLQDQGDKKFWPSEAKKLEINSERLRDIMARQDEWEHLVKKHQLGTKGKKITKKSRKYQRASGGGRKREFEPQIKQTGYTERDQQDTPSPKRM